MPFLVTSAYLQTSPLARRLCCVWQAQLTANAVYGVRIYRRIREPLPSLSMVGRGGRGQVYDGRDDDGSD